MQKNAAQEAYDIYSPRIFRVFIAYLQGYFGRNFDNVRVLKPASVDLPAGRAAIFYSNHTSWWDPILILYLASRFTPGRRAFGPMDAEALKKYGFMKRLGIFGVDQTSVRGAAQFLKTARSVLMDHHETLWMTPQGTFSDVRNRPIVFKPGLAHLARDCPVLLIPVAMEFPFWIETKPEMLVHFGKPIDASKFSTRTTEEWKSVLEEKLTTTMDDLADAAIARDADQFETIISGRKRVNPVYDAWRYVKAAVRGEKFSAAHGDKN